MHIAIEGMDGVGKTTTAKEVARRIGFTYYSKSLHDMNDSSGRYDDFVVVKEMCDKPVQTGFGFRGAALVDRILGANIISDRFLVSNFWAHTHGQHMDELEQIMSLIGAPDLTIILRADKSVITQRMTNRNPNDKDIPKLQYIDQAYKTMLEFVEVTGIPCVTADTTSLDFDGTVELVISIIRAFVKKQTDFHSEYVEWVVSPNLSTIDGCHCKCVVINRGGRVHLTKVFAESSEIILPEGIEEIDGFAFANCPSVRKITLCKSLRDVTALSFFGCETLEEITTYSGLFRFENGLLINTNTKAVVVCSSICPEEIHIPDDVVSINNFAFANNHSVRKINARGLQRVGFGAFMGCERLRTLDLGRVERFDRAALYGCVSVDDITISNCCTYDGTCLRTPEDDIIFVKNGSGELCIPECGRLAAWALARSGYEIVRFESGCGRIAPYCFDKAAVKVLECSEQTRIIADCAFFRAAALEAIVIRSENFPEIERMAFMNSGIKRLYLKSCELPALYAKMCAGSLIDVIQGEAEIERKYLISGLPSEDKWKKISESKIYRQYVSADPELRLSARINQQTAHYNITVKSSGMFARNEVRVTITETQYKAISSLIKSSPLIFDVSVYVRKSDNLRVSVKHCAALDVCFAEVEFESEADYVKLLSTGNLPDFFSNDVTYNEEYYVRNMWTRLQEINFKNGDDK